MRRLSLAVCCLRLQCSLQARVGQVEARVAEGSRDGPAGGDGGAIQRTSTHVRTHSSAAHAAQAVADTVVTLHQLIWSAVVLCCVLLSALLRDEDPPPVVRELLEVAAARMDLSELEAKYDERMEYKKQLDDVWTQRGTKERRERER